MAALTTNTGISFIDNFSVLRIFIYKSEIKIAQYQNETIVSKRCSEKYGQQYMMHIENQK